MERTTAFLVRVVYLPFGPLCPISRTTHIASMACLRHDGDIGGMVVPSIIRRAGDGGVLSLLFSPLAHPSLDESIFLSILMDYTFLEVLAFLGADLANYCL